MEERELRSALELAEETLGAYEHIVDQTQHLLNTRIAELEQARAELRERSAQLDESKRRFRQLAAATFEGVVIHEDGVILEANDSALELHGLDWAVGKKVMDLVADPADEIEQRHLTDDSGEPFESTHVRTDGSTFVVEARTKRIVYRGSPARVMAMRDITERKSLEDELRHLARTDFLTGIRNRRHFMELAETEVLRAKRYGHVLSVAMIDIDRFKIINDSYGHDVGDRAIKLCAQTCGEQLRTIDVFGRLGGEEFGVLMPETGIEAAAAVAERLRSAMEVASLSVGTESVSCTLSIGVTSRLQEEGLDQILGRADRLLYQAKGEGRNRIAVG